MSDSLKNRTVKGVVWSSVERFSAQGVQFIVMIIMARLLTPKDYGLIGMLAIFMAVSQSLIDSGFSQALIRKQNRSETDYSTVFYFNIAVAVCLYLILFLSAPLVASFYDTPELTAVMRAVCVGIIINSLAVVQRATLTVNLDFRTQAKATFLSATISGVVGIAMAYMGYGVWSLVVQQLLNLSANTFLLWIFSNWRPRLLYSWKSFRELFGFGSKLLLSELLNTLYKNLYTLVIGKIFTASTLGHYTRAHHFAEFPSSNLTGILQRVTYPVLCRLQDNDKQLADIYRRLLKMAAFIIFPLMVGLAAVSRPFIHLVLGTQWDTCATLLQILSFSMMWYPIHAINLNLLQVKGRSDLFLKLEIIKKLIGVAILCITVPLGLIWMCFGQVISSLISLFVNTYYTGKLINVGFKRQICDIAPSLIVCLAMYALIWALNRLIEPIWLQLVIGIISGVVFYLMCAKLLRLQELKEIKSIIKRH